MISRRGFVGAMLAMLAPVRLAFGSQPKRVSALESIDWSTLCVRSSCHVDWHDDAIYVIATARTLFESEQPGVCERRKVMGIVQIHDAEMLPQARQEAIEQLKDFCHRYDTDKAFRAEQDERYRRSLEDDEDA